MVLVARGHRACRRTPEGGDYGRRDACLHRTDPARREPRAGQSCVPTLLARSEAWGIARCQVQEPNEEDAAVASIDAPAWPP